MNLILGWLKWVNHLVKEKKHEGTSLTSENTWENDRIKNLCEFAFIKLIQKIEFPGDIKIIYQPK